MNVSIVPLKGHKKAEAKKIYKKRTENNGRFSKIVQFKKNEISVFLLIFYASSILTIDPPNSLSF